VQDAWVGSRDSEEDIDFDGDALNPHFSYEDDVNSATMSGLWMQ